MACGWLILCGMGCDVAASAGPDGGERWVVSISPAEGTRGISRRPRFRVRFDRRLLARSVDGSTVQLESGTVLVPLLIQFEPVTRELRFELRSGASPLRAGTAYRIRIRDVFDLAGHRLPEPYTAVVHTGDEVDAPPPPDRAGWPEVQPIFQRHCVDGACHGSANPAVGLDLSSGSAVRDTAINMPSQQFPRGTVDVDGARGARALAALRIIDVLGGRGSPASSYLVYKVVGDPHILGEAMPPPDGHSGGGLSSEEAEAISSWILAGAPTD